MDRESEIRKFAKATRDYAIEYVHSMRPHILLMGPDMGGDKTGAKLRKELGKRCWEFNYEFRCRHAGYGDRAGKMLAQVITSHRALVVVQRGEVIYATLDDKWDMLNQRIVNGG